ncbi:LysR family transcriptional regulator [Bordetella genomosp. 1]|uniref:LysR family transcriptional regulator n=1 Tax=Bordetella genomosp. 1 TaxID=1395607 RepID=A0A261SF44_9BORD|nr:LysR family transcriptional regulator [Bordetella genomosp. 1]MDQ8033204.1 LysR family transcriptional regulator [Bordetella sp.]OZI35691.1 LysR family transcriptional regulator [Bordetella genomosp. 1]
MADDDFPDDTGPGPQGSRPLNLRQIEVFRAIMMAGSISGAGRALHVSQPAVSRVLALTESRLGYALFERARSRLVPTPEARRLYGEVEQVYGGIQRVNDLAAALAHDGAGMLRVVSSASFGQRLVPQAILRMRKRNERSRVDYRSVTFDELAGYFLTGRADVGLSMSPPEHPNLSSTLLGEVPVVCVVPRGHALAEHAVIHAADFSSAQWIGYPPDTPLGRALAPFFGGAPACPAAVEVHSPVTACAFALQGLGPALVDRWCVTPELEGQVELRPVEPAVSAPIWATHTNLAPLPLLGRRFLAAAQQVLAEAADQSSSGSSSS